MAQRIVTELTCDMAGSAFHAGHEHDVETVRFGVAGQQYEIDLCGTDADLLRNRMHALGHLGRQVSARRPQKRRPMHKRRLDAQIRAYARSQGIAVSDAGRLGKAAREAWEQRAAS